MCSKIYLEASLHSDLKNSPSENFGKMQGNRSWLEFTFNTITELQQLQLLLIFPKISRRETRDSREHRLLD